MTRVTGFLVALGGANHIYTPVLFGESRVQGAITGVLMILGGIAAVYVGARMSRFGRRHTARLIKDPGGLEPGSYILYLRPFELDHQLYGIRPDPSRNPVRRLQSPLSRTFEEDLVLTLRWRLGKVVAVGSPGERLPRVGARRFYLPTVWKPTVSSLIGTARLVVLATGTTEGTLWELTECVRLLPPERLMLVVFTNRADYGRFRSAAQDSFASRAAELEGPQAARLSAFRLPDHPPLKNPAVAARAVGTQGLITFGPGWEPQFVRLDPTAVRALTDLGRLHAMIRRQVHPTLREVKRRLAEAPEIPPARNAGPSVPPPGAAADDHGTTAPRTE
ncbi:hypothetical protein ACFV0Z_07745 [Streptomyces xiamenensis]|uniref:hypothetical protein n=1 Tax=Streptomyces xiamenensis TaxID=408015 RepID=UPI00369E09DA